jgi:hypothetical protein
VTMTSEEIEALAAYTVNDTPADYGDDDRFACRLTGPDGFECVLGEPEDRTWSRDGRDAVVRLNAQHKRIAALEAGLRNVLSSAHPNERDHPTMSKAWRWAEGLLSNGGDDGR